MPSSFARVWYKQVHLIIIPFLCHSNASLGIFICRLDPSSCVYLRNNSKIVTKIGDYFLSSLSANIYNTFCRCSDSARPLSQANTVNTDLDFLPWEALITAYVAQLSSHHRFQSIIAKRHILIIYTSLWIQSIVTEWGVQSYFLCTHRQWWTSMRTLLLRANISSTNNLECYVISISLSANQFLSAR